MMTVTFAAERSRLTFSTNQGSLSPSSFSYSSLSCMAPVWLKPLYLSPYPLDLLIANNDLAAYMHGIGATLCYMNAFPPTRVIGPTANHQRSLETFFFHHCPSRHVQQLHPPHLNKSLSSAYSAPRACLKSRTRPGTSMRSFSGPLKSAMMLPSCIMTTLLA